MRKMSAMEKNRLIILFLVSLLLGTCTDAWEEHTRINDNVSPSQTNLSTRRF